MYTHIGHLIHTVDGITTGATDIAQPTSRLLRLVMEYRQIGPGASSTADWSAIADNRSPRPFPEAADMESMDFTSFLQTQLGTDDLDLWTSVFSA